MNGLQEQQEAYIEYILKGGTYGKELYFNCKGWGNTFEGPYVIVDGKQRLQAVREFMKGNIKAFGYYIHEFSDKPDILVARFSWNIAALETMNEVYKWYIDFNSGGNIHTKEEIEKVKRMIK